jgi:hypothetical protein
MEVEGYASPTQAISRLSHCAMFYHQFRPLFRNKMHKVTEILYRNLKMFMLISR